MFYNSTFCPSLNNVPTNSPSSFINPPTGGRLHVAHKIQDREIYKVNLTEQYLNEPERVHVRNGKAPPIG